MAVDRVIGQFSYAAEMPQDHVVLDLAWEGGQPRARVVAPAWVVQALVDTNIVPRPDDEYLGLPIALSYGVLVASVAGALFTVSGDKSVWPLEWGILIESHTRRWDSLRSH